MNSLDMYPFQQLYYSKIGYGQPTTLAGVAVEQGFSEWLEERCAEHASVLVVTGIASPRPFLKQIKKHFPERCKILAFKDHNRYSAADLNKISKEFNSLSNGPKYIITTEKDAVKLSELSLPGWAENLYYVPIQITLFDGKGTLSEAVLSYVAKNQTER